MVDCEQIAKQRAENFIKIAEEMFGPMHSSWRYAGVFFQDDAPLLSYAPRDGSVRIALSPRAKENIVVLDIELAHECCHLLWPVAVYPPKELEENYVIPSANVINEGISTYFSILMIDHFHGGDVSSSIMQKLQKGHPNYFISFRAVTDLLRADPNAVKKVQK